MDRPQSRANFLSPIRSIASSRASSNLWSQPTAVVRPGSSQLVGIELACAPSITCPSPFFPLRILKEELVQITSHTTASFSRLSRPESEASRAHMSKPLCFTGLKVLNAGKAGATDGGKAGGINGGHPVLESNMFEYSRSLPVHRYLFAS